MGIALNAHPTLSGQFNRATSIVQALTPEAHSGYQTWHRYIDQTMVNWLSNPANQNATPKHFWTKMYELYNTPDMIQRFGSGALEYIKGMMK